MLGCKNFTLFFFNLGFFRKHWRFAEKKWKRGDHIYSSLALPLDELSEIYLQFCIWDDYLLLSTAAHVITTLVLDEIYAPLEIKFWLNIAFVFLVDLISDSMIVVSHRKVVNLNLFQTEPLTNWTNHLYDPTFVFENRGKFGYSQCLILRLIRTKSFSH